MVSLEAISGVGALNELKALKRGIYVPVLTFFKGEHGAELDLDAFEKHITYVATSGVAGIVVLGSTGEAVSLTDDEKATVSMLMSMHSTDHSGTDLSPGFLLTLTIACSLCTSSDGRSWLC